MKVVLQDGIKDCGVCSLLSIIRYYGGDVSKEYLRELTNTTKSGVSAYKLIETAKIIGFDASGVTGKLEQIKKDNLPCIAHVIISKSYQHFIVIYGIDLKKEKLLIMDPAKGKKIISFSEFKLETSNNYIFLHPNKKLLLIKEKKIIKKEIIKYFKKNKTKIVFIVILTVIYFILNILTSFHFKYLIEYGINYNLSKNIKTISIILLLIYILKEISFFLRNTLLLKWSHIFDEHLTIKTYSWIILLPYIYYKNRTTGEVVSRISDLSIIKNYLSKLICFFTTDIITSIIFLIIMFNLNKKLTINLLLFIVIIFIFNILINRKRKDKIKYYHINSERTNTFLIESLASVDAIKGLHLEYEIIEKFKVKYKQLLESIYKLSLISELENYIKNNIINIIQVIILATGINQVIIKKMSLGELLIYQSILNYSISSIINILSILNEYNNYKLAVNRIEDLYTINKENFDGAAYYSMCNLDGNIIYNNFTYSYNSKLLFNNLSLTIKKGEKVLLCGESGTGKSTLVKALLRYIEVPFGMIKINNIDINHHHLDNLRRNITYVSQQEVLFSNTIFNNIVLNRKIDEKDFKKVASISLIDKMLEKDSLKYEKIVEENGLNFSGGERQRIILARSLLKKSDIYIFDEALSQIDINNEKIILNNIFKYLKGKTIIVISHRFNNQELFDRVIKIEKGKINEI